MKKYRQKYRQFTLCLYVWRFGYSLSANACSKVCGIPMNAFELRVVSLRGEMALAPREILGARPHRTPTPRFVRWDSGLPLRCDLLARLPFGHPPLPFVRRTPGGYINVWRCYELSQAFLRSRRAAIYDEHSLSELLMTAFTIYKLSLLSAAIACLFSTSVQASTCITAG